MREETRWGHMCCSFQLAARVLLYASFHRQDSTYHGLCCTSCGALAGGIHHVSFLQNKNCYDVSCIFPRLFILTGLINLIVPSTHFYQHLYHNDFRNSNPVGNRLCASVWKKTNVKLFLQFVCKSCAVTRISRIICALIKYNIFWTAFKLLDVLC